MRVAFLGLGIMGGSMAANLVKAGHEVTVWNRTPGKEVEGARSATSPAEAATRRRSGLDVRLRHQSGRERFVRTARRRTNRWRRA